MSAKTQPIRPKAIAAITSEGPEMMSKRWHVRCTTFYEGILDQDLLHHIQQPRVCCVPSENSRCTMVTNPQIFATVAPRNSSQDPGNGRNQTLAISVIFKSSTKSLTTYHHHRYVHHVFQQAKWHPPHLSRRDPDGTRVRCSQVCLSDLATSMPV